MKSIDLSTFNVLNTVNHGSERDKNRVTEKPEMQSKEKTGCRDRLCVRVPLFLSVNRCARHSHKALSHVLGGFLVALTALLKLSSLDAHDAASCQLPSGRRRAQILKRASHKVRCLKNSLVRKAMEGTPWEEFGRAPSRAGTESPFPPQRIYIMCARAYARPSA